MRKLLVVISFVVAVLVCHAAGLSITACSPTSGPVGTVVTLTGTNFNPTAQVFIYPHLGTQIPANPVTYVSSTTLLATVPAMPASCAIPCNADITVTLPTPGTPTSVTVSVADLIKKEKHEAVHKKG